MKPSSGLYLWTIGYSFLSAEHQWLGFASKAAASAAAKTVQSSRRSIETNKKQQQPRQSNNNPWTFDLIPTAVLVEERRRRKLLHHHQNESSVTTNSFSNYPSHWFATNQSNALYATIPDPLDPLYKDDIDLQEFHRYRYLSRFEIQFRLNHDLELMSDWDGTYENQEWLDGENEKDENVEASKVKNNSDSLFFRRRLAMHKGGQYNNYQAVPLSQGYGTHFANVWVGSPRPQRKTLIVDTGSHYTAFPCTGCNNCGANHHTDPYFDPSKSTSFHQLQCSECQEGVVCEAGMCKFQQAYTEGSTWDAIQVRDRVYCGGSDMLDAVDPMDERYTIDFMFGCQTGMTGLFVTQLADGIIGMSAHPATLPKKLFDNRRIEHNMFALCYRRELGTSKRGVHAGSMSLGGVSTSLDTGPIVYAKNLARVGWFTVYVKNIYIRSGGGQSAYSTDHQRRTVRVRVDRAALNSGKGVIVDSGTTDTYLNQKVAKEFNRAWKQITGVPYSHTPISLTPEQLRQLPTILIQCQSASAKRDPSIENYASMPGYAGSLDPSSPEDLLIAIPATSYMDYSPITRRYMSRLYFTETHGGVLGSNTMQGHNVVFDWENGRVGFSESTCAYDKTDVPKAATDDGYSTDCIVSDPIVTKACIETVDSSLCRHNPTNIALLGTETWTSIVESPGTESGISCTGAAEDISHKDPRDDPVVKCSGEGVCEEERPCQLTCPELALAAKVTPLPQKDQELSNCGDSYWSACDYNCKQTRIKSIAFSDGTCHEVDRDTRPCHIGACARSSPCRVPYIVHAVIGFKGGFLSKWSFASEYSFVDALVSASNTLTNRTLFEHGDVHVLSALPWFDDDMDIAAKAMQRKSERVGFKVVVEVAVYNNITGSLQVAEGTAEQNGCGPDELYVLAKHALSIKKDVLLNDRFMTTFVAEMKGLTTADENPAFAVLYTDKFDPFAPDLISAWTVQTSIDEAINYFGPQRPFMAKLYALLSGATVVSTFLLVFLVLWTLLWLCDDVCRGHDAWNLLQRFWGKNAQPHRYIEINGEGLADEIEERAIRGSSQETAHKHTRYKLTIPKKRARSSSLSAKSEGDRR